MKKAVCLLTTYVTLCVWTVVLAGGLPNNSIDSSHWAYQYIQDGTKSGWISDVPENIDSDLSRADFLIMLQKATGLSPESSAAQMLTNHSSGNNSINFIATSHRVYTEGWLKVAENFGIVNTEDYKNQVFEPDSPISRQEAITMTARSMGLQELSLEESSTKPFADWDILPTWLKIFTQKLFNVDVVEGYPDGKVRTEQNLTFAEGVAIVDRIDKEMHQGADAGIQVADSSGITASLPVSCQIINGKLFVPLRGLYEIGSQNTTGLKNFTWNPKEQSFVYSFYLNDGMYSHTYEVKMFADNAGIEAKYLDTIGTNPALEPFKNGNPRIQNGELMVAVDLSGDVKRIAPTIYYTSWDSETKTLQVSVKNQL